MFEDLNNKNVQNINNNIIINNNNNINNNISSPLLISENIKSNDDLKNENFDKKNKILSPNLPNTMIPNSSTPSDYYDVDIYESNRFVKLEKRGKGRYGSVYKALDRATGNYVGLKKMELQSDEDGILSTTIREISILKELNHKNIIKLLGNYTINKKKKKKKKIIIKRNDIMNIKINDNHNINNNIENNNNNIENNNNYDENNNNYDDSDSNDDDIGQLYLVFEYIEQDLSKYLDNEELRFIKYGLNNEGIELTLFKEIIRQLLEAVYYCHSQGFLHRDIKPQNILFEMRNNKPIIKLADFGLSRTFTPPIRPLTNEVVTLWYRSPELLLGSSIYTPPVDMWSVGVITAELARCGGGGNTKDEKRMYRPLFHAKYNILQLYKIFSLRGTPTEEIWPGVTSLPYWNNEFPKWPISSIEYSVPSMPLEGVDFIEQCLALDPRKRLTSREALEHPFISGHESENN